MEQAWCSAQPRGIRLAVQITPNAKKTEVIGVLGDSLKLKLQAQPIEGRANEALIKYLSGELGVPKSALTITHGLTSKRKLVEVVSATLTPEQAARILLKQSN
ncbi:DUF167 domain-containing protein [Massilia antarctica]|uniref:DUF167 domain-containing protein n=1 Tax=Massilia antarctica TaxID=2765360 RepID=UPI0006BB903B|nr:DUF167 domain-containing protein [Massilia sp. H27-R4]MCY0913546.1 DUF167 domain-containing protein [Massilia sp. H27-R4]CUI09694.1 hypothetical protein BN2497_14165 [Janthinobacterium sp. CG23_2]CUU33480.1 hypothetical protein BN3177_14165 [Janthinobacterium sp. CG23_2]